jgi:hypothetical protein
VKETDLGMVCSWSGIRGSTATAITIAVTAADALGQAAAQFPQSSALMFFGTVDCCFF